jgi:putative transcriptional regulator
VIIVLSTSNHEKPDMTTVTRSLAAIRKHRPNAARLARAPEDDERLPDGRIPMPAAARSRLKVGRPRASDLAAFRGMLGLSQPQFATSLGISLGTLRNWEQGRRTPDGAAIALLRLAARHPRLLLESLSIAE